MLEQIAHRYITSEERAESERQQAELERQRAEAERRKREQLEAFLRSQGFNPDQLPDG